VIALGVIPGVRDFCRHDYILPASSRHSTAEDRRRFADAGPKRDDDEKTLWRQAAARYPAGGGAEASFVVAAAVVALCTRMRSSARPASCPSMADTRSACSW
jgi:hypothetical protein